MALRTLRVWVALTLMAFGGFLYAASWLRWADACPWRGNRRPDNRRDPIAESQRLCI